MYIPDPNIRSTLAANPAWLNPAWEIDPQNITGRASDLNSGVPGSPVLTWNGGVIQKYGTQSPYLAQNTTWKFLSSSPADGSDPIVFSPVAIHGAQLNLIGTLDNTRLVASGTLSSVTAKNRNAGVLLSADLGASAAVGMMLVNTTAGKLSRCFLIRNTAGTVFQLSQPMTPGDAFPVNITPVQVNTYSNGDTFDLYSLVDVDVVVFKVIVADFGPTNENFAGIRTLNVQDTTNPAPASHDTFYCGDSTVMTDAKFNRKCVLSQSFNGKSNVTYNCFYNGGLTGGEEESVQGTGRILFINAGCVAGPGAALLGSDLDNDVCLFVSARLEHGSFGTAYIDSGVVLQIDAVDRDTGGSVLWGPGAIDVNGILAIRGTGDTATTVFKQLGPITIWARTTAFNATIAAPSVINGGIAITPANIDASAVGLFLPGGGRVGPF